MLVMSPTQISLRANFVEQAENWLWGSAYVRRMSPIPWLVAPSDSALPRTWRAWGNSPQSSAEVDVLRRCLQRGLPCGDAQWAKSSAIRLGVESTLRPRGRPREENKES